MGRRVVACAAEAPDMTVTAAVDVPECPLIGRDAGIVAGCGENGVVIEDGLEHACRSCDVVIDFALADSVAQRVDIYANMGKPFVIGTTGASPEGIEAINRVAQLVPAVHAPNFSVGVNLLFALAGRAAQALGDEYDVEVVEMHHRKKKDAPSGTALRLADVIDRSRGGSQSRVHGRHGAVGERPAGEVGIHALRGGDVVGEHTLIFATEGERVELTHKAGSRDTFARGALRAARFLVGKQPGLYKMADVLGLDA